MDGVKGFWGGLAFTALAVAALAVNGVRWAWKKTRAGWDWIAKW